MTRPTILILSLAFLGLWWAVAHAAQVAVEALPWP